MAVSLPFEFRRVRDFGQSFSALFEFLRYNWKNLSKSLVFIAGPLILIFGVAGGSLVNEIVSSLQRTSFQAPDFTENILMIMVEGMILMVAYFLAGASVLAVTNEYILMSMGDEMEQFSVSLLWGKISARLGSHIANFIIINGLGFVITLPIVLFAALAGMSGLGITEILIIVYSLMFFVGLPIGIYFGTVISLYPAIRVQENSGVFAAIKRSFHLMKNHFWSSLGFYIVTGLIQGIVGSVFMIPFYVFYIIAIITIIPQASSSPDGIPDFGIGFQIAFTISGVLAVGGGLLLNSVTATAHTLQYFNLVERKEGLGMMAKLDLLGVPQNGQGAQDDHTEEY